MLERYLASIGDDQANLNLFFPKNLNQALSVDSA
jgi:hypothetical protein